MRYLCRHAFFIAHIVLCQADEDKMSERGLRSTASRRASSSCFLTRYSLQNRCRSPEHVFVPQREDISLGPVDSNRPTSAVSSSRPKGFCRKALRPSSSCCCFSWIS